MIRRRFSVFRGVGPKTERVIWDSGVPDWQRFIDAGAVSALSRKAYSRLSDQVREWIVTLERADVAFFSRNLARTEHWHLYKTFGDAVRYLDIETTGLNPSYDKVTVVGIYDGRKHRALVRGKNLTARTLGQAMKGCKLLVTYNGSTFDVPFLRRAFPGVNWDVPHFDLCFAGRKIGLTGGLKVVEKALGIIRPPDVGDIDGFEAVLLWHQYHRHGKASALKKLKKYNEVDTRNLATMAPVIFDGLCRKFGL